MDDDKDKFEIDCMFHLSKEEWQDLRSKNLTSSWGGRRTIPYAFTEQYYVSHSDKCLKTLKYQYI